MLMSLPRSYARRFRVGLTTLAALILIVSMVTAVTADIVCPKCGFSNHDGAKYCGRQLAVAGPPANPRPAQVWRSPKDSKEMVWVGGGEFLMGSRESEKDAEDDEHPQRRVHLDGFWIDKCEVTVGEYRRFCQATGREMTKAPRWGWINDHPVVNVTWDDAAAYAKWAEKRLPTEAEWEKAARGTDGRKYPWGNEEPGDGRCNLSGSKDGYERTAPVGRYPSGASPYGCLDMAGNVWEWCADWYDPGYYKSGPTRNPPGPSSGVSRVLRGGSWSNYARYTRCANRNLIHPTLRSVSGFGFRCARDSR